MSIKQKVRIKIQQMNIDDFSNQTLLDSIDYLLWLSASNEASNHKRFNARKYYLPKVIFKNYNLIINGKLLWLTNVFRYKTIWRN